MNSQREGFSIVEAVVAMVVLAIVLSMMGALTFSAARQSQSNNTSSQRLGVSLELVNRYSALPFSSLANYRDTLTFDGSKYERVVTVTSTPDSAIVLITTKPLESHMRQSQVRLVRARGTAAQNPLCTPSC